MAERPWVTPEELKEYTEFEEVKNRADSKLPGGELGHRLLQQQIRRPGEIPRNPGECQDGGPPYRGGIRPQCR